MKIIGWDPKNPITPPTLGWGGLALVELTWVGLDWRGMAWAGAAGLAWAGAVGLAVVTG